jgi:rubredoxin
MAFKDKHIGNKTDVSVEFPCPNCGKGIAKGIFNKTAADEDGHIDVHCDCPACGTSYDGTAVMDSTGVNVDVTIDDKRIQDKNLNVY